jgi:hypothetical protein
MVCNSFLGAHVEESVFYLTLRVTGGTKAYAGATGTLSLVYVSQLTFFTGNPRRTTARLRDVDGNCRALT